MEVLALVQIQPGMVVNNMVTSMAVAILIILKPMEMDTATVIRLTAAIKLNRVEVSMDSIRQLAAAIKLSRVEVNMESIRQRVVTIKRANQMDGNIAN